MLSKSKAYQLLKLLTSSELSVLRNRLVRDNRIRLLILVDHLSAPGIEKKGEGLKEFLFQKLFNKSYSSKRDYLLRNEFRLLSSEIEEVLVESEIRDEIKNNENAFNYYLLRILQTRNAFSLFNKEFTAAYDLAVTSSDYYAAHNISGLNFLNYSEFMDLDEKNSEYLKTLNELKLTHLSCFYLTAFRQHQLNSEFAMDIELPYSIYERPLVKDVEVNFNPYENDYSRYLYLKAKTFLLPMEERVENLEKCLDFVQIHLEEAAFFEDELMFCLSSLAKTHSQLFDFEKGAAYFEKYFEISKDVNKPQHLMVLCDYIAKLIKLKQYDKATELLIQNRPYFSKIPRYDKYSKCLLVACYSFTHDKEKLFPELPENLENQSKQMKVFYRIHFAIYAYLDQRTGDAFREIQNLNNSIRRTQLAYNILPVIKFYNRFFYLLNKFLVDDPKLEHYLTALKKEMEEYAQSSSPEYRSYLPLKWLRMELARHIP